MKAMKERVKEMWRRILFLSQQRQLEQDLDEEMRFHLAMKAERNRESGLSRDEAEWTARRQFGNVTRMKEQSREAWGWSALERFGKDVQLSLRSLRRETGFTALAVLTLGLGMGAMTSVFSVIRGVLLTPLPYEEPSRLMAIWQNRAATNDHRLPTSNPNFVDWREQAQSFTAMGAASVPATVTVQEPEPDAVPVYLVDRDFLSVLGVRHAAKGRLFIPQDFAQGGERVALMTWPAWQARFGGDASIVGRSVQTGGRPLRIIGVLPAGYRQPPLDFRAKDPEFLLPQDFSRMSIRGGGMTNVIGRLKPGVRPEQAEAELIAIGRRLAAQYQENRGVGVEAAPLDDVFVGKVRRPLWLLMGAVSVLLLCACLNMANMMLARAVRRQPEYAIRAALGGRRGLIFGQVIAEGLVLSVMGALVGFGIAELCVPSLVTAAGALAPRSDMIRVDGGVLAFSLFVAFTVALLFALAPAMWSARTNVSESLRNTGRSGLGRGVVRMRLWLVGAEIAMAVMLLAASGLLLRSFWQVLAVDMGFDPENVLTAEVAMPSRPGFLGDYLERVRRLPGVVAAGAAGTVPLALSPTAEVGIVIRGHAAPPGETRRASVVPVTPGYFSAMRVRLLRGRLIDYTDAANTPEVALVNASFVKRYLPQDEPIGQIVEIGLGSRNFVMGVARIVGVVEDVRQSDVLTEAQPQMWKPHAQCPMPFMALAVRTSGPVPELDQMLRGEIKTMGLAVPLTRVRAAGEYYRDALAHRRVSLLLLGILSALALVLSAVGVYGVMAYSLMQRRKEIGIRMAMGAQPGDVVAMVVRQGLAVAAAGLFVGTLAALALTRLFGTVLYGVTPYDPWTYGLVALVFLTVAGAATYLPGRRATRSNPVAALRFD
ncbi:MAG TPA: ABC transporter permease [Paludibaculum sp.]|jgi:putative ABC transport system permease protein